MSVAQRCLSISELAEAIAAASINETLFGWNPWFDAGIRLGNVVVLARTCRSIFYACIPIIWRRLTTMDDLLKCLPAHLWTLVPMKTKRGDKFLQLVSTSINSKLISTPRVNIHFRFFLPAIARGSPRFRLGSLRLIRSTRQNSTPTQVSTPTISKLSSVESSFGA